MVDAVVIMVLQKKVPDLGDSSNSRDGDDPGGRGENISACSHGERILLPRLRAPGSILAEGKFFPEHRAVSHAG